jgi:hypothetical protein
VTVRESGNLEDVVRAEPAWSPDMPIFLAPAWLSSQGPESGWLESRPEPGLHLVLPFVGRRKAGLRWVQFQWGVWSSRPIDAATEQAFLEGVVARCRADGFDFIVQPATMALFQSAPAGSVSAPFGTVLVDLTPAEEDILRAMDSRCRNNIRKATAEGVTIEWGAHLADEAHALCTSTMTRSDRGFPTLQQFRDTIAGLGDAVDVGVARLGGVAQACVVNPCSTYGTHCLHAGTAADSVRGAANLLQWEAMRRARAHGSRVYDFVGVRVDPEPGSKYAGLRQFKTRFGGKVAEGCLWKMPLNAWKYRAYAMMKRVRGDGPDIIDQEGQAR